MKKFSEMNIGDEFFATCSISEKEMGAYLEFSRIKNRLLESDSSIVSGRAILSRMEGEFTRLEQISGNVLMFAGTDGDAGWENRNTRFLQPLRTGETLKIRFVISGKDDSGGEFGKIAVDFEGTNQDGKTVVISRKNLYRIKKEPDG